MEFEVIVEARQRLAERLIQQRKPGGFWEGRIGSDIQASAAAAIALHDAGEAASASRAVSYLLSCQNPDGGCGHALGVASDIESSAAALAALRCIDVHGRYHAQAEALQRHAGHRTPSVKGLVPNLLQHFAGLAAQVAPRAAPSGPLPYPERMAHELVQGYLARDAARISGLGKCVDEQRSWRGLIGMTAVASSCLHRIGAPDPCSVRWLRRFQNDDGGFPHTHSLAVWDTVIASLALLDHGVDPGSKTWLGAAQHESGGWYWDSESRSTIDFDDTGYALWVLLRCGTPRSDPRVQRGIALLRATQSPDGGLATFERPGLTIERPYWNQSTPDVTAHVLQALKAADLLPEAQRAENWLIDTRSDAGLWRGLWFRGDLYSTLSALEAVDKGKLELDATLRQVLEQRRSDGGFGAEESTAEETAWGVGAMIEAGIGRSPLLHESVEQLVDLCSDPIPSRVGALPLFAKHYSDTIFPLAFGLSTLNKYVQLIAGN